MKNTMKLTLVAAAFFAATSLHADTPVATNAVPVAIVKSPKSESDSVTAVKKKARPKRKPGFRLPSKQFKPKRNR